MERVKREYQSWVANETLEDYALRYAASSYRQWSPGVVANTALGGISFLALEAIGASITLSFGAANALVAIAVVSVLIFAVSLPIAYWCAASNIDIDLLTRGAGFGYIGSTITSLIYACFTFIFFALETAIWAQALHLAFGLNLVIGYLLCSVVVIPLVFYGVTMINRLQAWTQPLWVLLLVAPLVLILLQEPALLRTWTAFAGTQQHESGGIDLLLVGAAAGVLFSLVAQIGEQTDYLRFLPERTAHNGRAWWLALIAAGPGWILVGGLKIAAGSLLAVFALQLGSTREQATEPAHLFFLLYRQIIEQPTLAIALAVVFVSVSQLKINVTNAYSGSLAWSNCFVRLAHYHPGRVIWLVFNVVIALLLTLLGIFETLQTVLSIYSTVAIAWIGALVADLVVLKRIGISPPYIEFKRAHLYRFNPVGCGGTLVAAAVSIAAYAGALGETAQAFFGFIALATAFATSIAIGVATKGRYYIARADLHHRHLPTSTMVRCCICLRDYEAPDMAHCTHYRGAVCSLCCMLELNCHDACKHASACAEQGAAAAPRSGATPAAIAAAPIAPPASRSGAIARRAPATPAPAASAAADASVAPVDQPPPPADDPAYRPRSHMRARVGRFFGVLSVAAVLMAVAFTLTYRFMDLHQIGPYHDLPNIMIRLYIASLVVMSIGIWWIVLSHESREQAQRELLQSLRHLEQTRRSLSENEKLASLGRLVAGVAHEINTPAGIIVSTASYLSDRTARAQEQARAAPLGGAATSALLRDASESARLLLSNAQRIAGLVLNFKRLAVDRINELPKDFDLAELVHSTLHELGGRIREAGVELTVDIPPGLVLRSYPISLGQVVGNLTINALQHAFEPGRRRLLQLRARADGEDVVLEVRDNGRGIPAELQSRVFEPFFTTNRTHGGSGLGLYLVSQYVTRQMSGTISIERPDEGDGPSGVRFRIVLPRTVDATVAGAGAGEARHRPHGHRPGGSAP